jgi:hypothetical protein
MHVLTMAGTNDLFAAKKLFDIKLSNVNLTFKIDGFTVCPILDVSALHIAV